MSSKRYKNLHTGLVEEHVFLNPRAWKLYYQEGATEGGLSIYLKKVGFNPEKDTYTIDFDRLQVYEAGEVFMHLPPVELAPKPLLKNIYDDMFPAFNLNPVDYKVVA